MSTKHKIWLLVVTNLVTFAGFVYCFMQYDKLQHTQLQLIPKQYTVPITGYRDHVGYEADGAGNRWPKWGDSLKVRQGDPIIYVTYFAWEPNVEPMSEEDVRPEFIGGTYGSWDWSSDEKPVFRDPMDLWRNGFICVYTLPTDTMDLQGAHAKRIHFTPHIKIPQNGELVELADSIDFYVVE